MSDDKEAFVSDLIQFSRESMEWCAKESENATQNVTDILGALMEDAKRIASMSEDSLKVINELKEKMAELSQQENADKLVETLSKFCKQNIEVNNFAFPIVETLQFQDRVRQNMENLVKMLNFWAEFRKDFADKDDLTEEDKIKFGNELLNLTTMAEERDIVRAVIPGVEEEKEVESVLMF